jgi:hypothetical protein
MKEKPPSGVRSGLPFVSYHSGDDIQGLNALPPKNQINSRRRVAARRANCPARHAKRAFRAQRVRLSLVREAVYDALFEAIINTRAVRQRLAARDYAAAAFFLFQRSHAFTRFAHQCAEDLDELAEPGGAL